MSKFKIDTPIAELLEYAEYLKEEGLVVLIKFDGQRTADQYTVVVSNPNAPTETMRLDRPTLQAALVDVFNELDSHKV